MGQLKTDTQREPSSTWEKKMNTICILIVAMALITAEAAPRPQFGNFFNQENLKDHGRNKFVVGAGVAVAGALLGNQQIQQAGTGIAVAGLVPKGAAHAFPTANGGASSLAQLFG